MDTEHAKTIIVTERINGWWVTAHDESGHEQHHGPYVDRETARNEADLLAAGSRSDAGDDAGDRV